MSKVAKPVSNAPVVLVGIQHLGFIDQFLMLPSSFTYGGIEFRVVANYNSFLDPSVFDLVISGGENEETITKNTSGHFNKVNGNTVLIERLLKSQQQLALSKAFDSYSNDKEYVEGFFNLGGIKIRMDGRHKSIYSLPDNIGGRLGYVIKPEGGARSIGIMKFKAETNIRLFAQKFNVLRKSIEDISELVALVNKFEGSIDLGSANSPTEVLRFIKDIDNTFFIQNQAPKNIKELRVLRNGGGKLLICSRLHLKDETNGFETVYASLTDPQLLNELGMANNDAAQKRMDSIEEFIRSRHFPMSHGSVDLWIDDSSAMNWGIFEYQPQYGHSYIPDYPLSQFLMQSIYEMHLAY